MPVVNRTLQQAIEKEDLCIGAQIEKKELCHSLYYN